MPDIHPFKALWYDPDKVRPIDTVVGQPYDKINEDLRKKYYERSPYHVVRMTYGRPEPNDTPENNPYTRARDYLREWLKTGVLVEHDEPTIYAYDIVYKRPDGTERKREGFVALVELSPFSEKKVLPHEETFPGPKADRLSLMRAARANFGHVFLLYEDPKKQVESILAKEKVGSPDREVRDDDGFRHRVWAVRNPKAVQAIQALLKPVPAIVADGHHRYETAIAFRDECEKAGMRCTGNACHHRRMATFVNSEGDLTIFPTHRLIRGRLPYNIDDIEHRLGPWFEIKAFEWKKPAGEPKARLEFEAYFKRLLGGRMSFGLILGGANRYLTIRLKEPDRLNEFIPEAKSLPWKQLDVSILHRYVLGSLLALDPEKLERDKRMGYARHADEVFEAIRKGEATLGFLLHPVAMSQIRDVVMAGDRMPQKSTDFFPKALSGLVMCRYEIGEPEKPASGS